MKEDHEDGRCYACGEDAPVRWKNLYTIGSEGTWLCMDCEMFIVNLLQMLARKSTRKELQKRKDEKKLKNT